MSETEKLQRAIELTIAAGYQLKRDAFEFLRVIGNAEDPTMIVEKAIQKIQGQDEKVLFIDRAYLEQFAKGSEPSKEIVPQPAEETVQQLPGTSLTGGKEQATPYAKDVEADIRVLDDPASKLSSNGTIEDYLAYFQDRFRVMEKLLRQRMDVKSAGSVIDAVKASPNAKIKVIGMITEKREAKQKTLLTIEDLHANVLVLVPQNASEELRRKTQLLLLDQVVCLSVAKTRSNLLICEDIVLPDIAPKPQRKAPIPVYAVLTSDMHVGSTKFQREPYNRFILWLNGKYGNDKMREIAAHVKYVLIAGDVVDGIGIYPNQMKELATKDIYEQYRLAGKYIEQIPDYIEVVVIPGNHDVPRKALPQPAISGNFLKALSESRNIHSLGNPSLLSLHGVEVLAYHGRSLDDIISTVPGIDFGHPEKAMKLLLQSRHLAPLYGGKTPLSPEERDCLVIEHVPDIFHSGHVHVLGYENYRGVLLVNSGGWQERTDYMRRMGLTPTPGKVPVINLQTLEITIIPFI